MQEEGSQLGVGVVRPTASEDGVPMVPASAFAGYSGAGMGGGSFGTALLRRDSEASFMSSRYGHVDDMMLDLGLPV